jgi:hypothetical protein
MTEGKYLPRPLNFENGAPLLNLDLRPTIAVQVRTATPQAVPTKPVSSLLAADAGDLSAVYVRDCCYLAAAIASIAELGAKPP